MELSLTYLLIDFHKYKKEHIQLMGEQCDKQISDIDDNYIVCTIFGIPIEH